LTASRSPTAASDATYQDPHKHEAIPGCGSYEVVFPDGRAPVYFYFEDVASRRLRPESLMRDQALEAAQTLARNEQAKLDLKP
jgi:hypothetical protein